MILEKSPKKREEGLKSYGGALLSDLWLESPIKLTLFIPIRAQSNDFSTVCSHFPQVPHRSQDEKKDKGHYKVK